MDRETYARVRQLFAEAIELCPAERETFLHEVRESVRLSQDNEEVLQEVESLLAFYRDSDRAEA